MSSGLSLAAVSELPVRWRDHARSSLADGRPIVEPGFALFPAMAGTRWSLRSTWRSPRAPRLRDAAVFGDAIAQAVLRLRLARDEAAPPAASPAEQAKLQLLSLLEGNDWNIAEVARLLGVTRRTVYMRLRSFGIERRRVPKLYKKMPVSG